MTEVRIDKWLWAVRIFKTRTIAADACKLGRVTMGGKKVKASRTLKVGDVVEVRKPPVTYSFRVLALAEQHSSPDSWRTSLRRSNSRFCNSIA